MSIKNRSRSILLAALLLLNSLLEAQTGGYAGFSSVQRLSWIGDGNVLRYEVQVEREDEDGFRIVVREFTDECFIELSLPQGKYHYRVIPYDFLNRPARGTEWANFEVRTVHRPELDLNLLAIFYIGENDVHTLYISGKNMEKDSGFSLQRPGAAPIVPYAHYILADSGQAWLFFSKNQLIPGTYEIIIKNQSGLETRGGAITISYLESGPEPKPESKPKAEPEPKPISKPEPEPEGEPEPEEEPDGRIEDRKPFDITLSAAWMPLIPIYGEAAVSFKENLSLSGAAIRLGIISSKPDFLNFGAELAASWFIFGAVPHGETALQHVVTADINLLAQKRLTNQAMALTYRLGAGLSLHPGSQELIPQPITQSLFVNAGVSFRLAPLKHFFLEAGLDYTHVFTYFPMGIFRPWLGVGCRF